MTRLIREVAVNHDLPEHLFPWVPIRLTAAFGDFPNEMVKASPFWCHPVRFDEPN